MWQMGRNISLPKNYLKKFFYAYVLLTKTHNIRYNVIATKKVAIIFEGKMKLSSKTHYGLMACHVLGMNYPNNLVSASVLENKINVSGKYLEKIMRILSNCGIVSASRGANGGYFLAKPPEQITIGEIVRALEDNIEIVECVKNDGKCKCCPSSVVWKKLYEEINNVLNSMTLKQMINGQIST